ncbi:MAG: hypothetical protein ACFE8B_09505 [Candidatus Hermodarchaeota archaeon]
MVGLGQIVDQSLRKRLKERFGKEVSKRIIECIRAGLGQGLQNNALVTHVEECVKKFLPSEVAHDIAVGVSGHIGVG